MYNYFMLVGVITKEVEVKTLDDGRKVTELNLAVRRSFKNAEGEYGVDFIRVSLWEFLVDIAKDSLKKGDRIGIKGRISTRMIEHANGYQVKTNDLIAERLIYLEKNEVIHECEEECNEG